MKSFIDMGYKNVKPEELVAFKAWVLRLITSKRLKRVGYKK